MLRLLTIAGSDSGGGAGIQADIKTFTALGAFGMSAITAVTAQNTLGVTGVWELPAAAVAQQIAAVISDIGVDAVKVGMLASAALVAAVADALTQWAPGVPLVVDPVMQAKGGQALLSDNATQALLTTLFPLATVITPNLPEAAALLGRTVATPDEQRQAGQDLLGSGAQWVLVKGGHAHGPVIVDWLVGPDRVAYEHPRLDTPHTHGTGCTLSSAIAVGLARGLPLPAAVDLAERYVTGAIQHAPGLGQGHGPLQHMWAVQLASPPSEQEDLTPWHHG